MSFDHDKLLTRRKKLGLTQKQVAESSGMAQSNYARLEAGRRKKPNIETLERVAKALGCTVDKLIGD